MSPVGQMVGWAYVIEEEEFKAYSGDKTELQGI